MARNAVAQLCDLPAVARLPQDKAKVGSAVQVVERWILMRLRHQRFASVDDVNGAIEPLLAQLNAKAFQKLPGSRVSAFAELDAPALQALPAQSWEYAMVTATACRRPSHPLGQADRAAEDQRRRREP